MPSSFEGHNKTDNVEPELKFHLASRYHELINVKLKEFKAKLADSMEVGITLGEGGATFSFYLDEVSHADPHLIAISGTTQDGQPIEVIQDCSRVHFVLQPWPKREK